jgi:Family of unknown function (DUF6084)
VIASGLAPCLRFTALGAEAMRSAVVPTLRLRLAIETDDARSIRGVALNVQVAIAAERRRYDAAETERLGELFGSPEQWSRSLGPVPWTRSTANVPAFDRRTNVDVVLPCSYDFEIAAAKYLAALAGGEIPVTVQFSGNVFYDDGGRLQIAMIPWDAEASLRIPLALWHEAVDAAFPDSAWLRVRRETFGRLQAYRSRSAFVDWDAMFAALLGAERT